MRDVVFITGNAHKAEQLAKYIGDPIEYVKVELDEIQSLALRDVVRHKVMEAYKAVQRPVLVEDVSLEFTALGTLPGTFIRWFEEELGAEGLCKLLEGKERSATARCMYGYFDGQEEKYFEGSMQGTITEKPKGNGGYGWDCVFIPQGFTCTRAEMSETEYEATYLQIKPLAQVHDYLRAV
jgi:non-canonical purine NTP pyrophosphatase (RdgB/HAM1 family)